MADGGHGGGPPVGAAFLLAQLGAHVTAAYAERVAELELTPAETGVLRLLVQSPGISQQELAGRLGVVPSAVVALMDQLEGRGLVERRRSEADRRSYAVRLTAVGDEVFTRVRAAARDHERAMTAGLTADERDELVRLLGKVADAQGLTPGVHPGYRRGDRRR